MIPDPKSERVWPNPLLKDNRADHEGPFAWYEKEDPCSVAGNFELLGCGYGSYG